jgi:hypothetical protein
MTAICLCNATGKSHVAADGAIHKEQRSSVVYNSLSPVWDDACFEFRGVRSILRPAPRESLQSEMYQVE